MTSESNQTIEIFSFHLANTPMVKMLRLFLRPSHKGNIPGPRHSEGFFTMNLGEPTYSLPRYNFRSFGFFAWWEYEASQESFLRRPEGANLAKGWHVRMHPYRRWSEITELKDISIRPELAQPTQPVVAVTLARLKITQLFRFIKWGRPVEGQVRDHKGQRLALAAMRPWNTFCTFSIWQNEAEMIHMVQGRDKAVDGDSHKKAMRERARKDFHYEFSTMRFVPFKEFGERNGRAHFIVP